MRVGGFTVATTSHWKHCKLTQTLSICRVRSLTYPFLPRSGPHHLGTQLNSVILIVFFGSGNLLASLPHFILCTFLPLNALPKLLLKNKPKEEKLLRFPEDQGGKQPVFCKYLSNALRAWCFSPFLRCAALAGKVAVLQRVRFLVGTEADAGICQAPGLLGNDS